MVRGLYAAFRRGDVPALLSSISDQVEWSEPANPFNPAAGTRRGHAGVIEWLRIGHEAEEILVLEPSEFIVDEDTVAVVGHSTCRVRATGRSYDTDFVHLIRVTAGRIDRFQEFFDTYAAAEAFRIKRQPAWNRWRRAAALAGVFGLAWLAFVAFVQPWYERWGASDEEVLGSLPGDGIVPDAGSQETRAITIDAPIDRVWPWLAQLGQDRGGFYSYDALENLVGCRMPTEDVLRPDKQAWALGDRLWMYPPEAAGGVGFAVLRDYVPGRALAFGTHVPGSPADIEDGSWAFVLRPMDASRTRLLVRGRVRTAATPWILRTFNRAVFSPMHFVMERRTMIGLKDVAERGERSRLVNHLHVVLWTVTLVALAIASLRVFRRGAWLRMLAGVAAAAALFIFLTLWQPPLLLGAGLVGGMILWLLKAR